MDNNHKPKRKGYIAFWIALLRGLLVILLGIVLLFSPEKTSPFLFNMMGFYWLTTGILLLRHLHPVFEDQEDRMLGKRLSMVLGLFAVLAGVLVISRILTSQIIPEAIIIQLLGVVILMTGILHLTAQFRVGRFLKGKRTTGHKIIAVFEILLGALLMLYLPYDERPIAYALAIAWALIGGGLIISDALYHRARLKGEQGVEREQLETDGE